MAGAVIPCPSTEELERLLHNQLGDTDRSSIETHVEGCASCRERIDRLGPPTSPCAGVAAVPPPDATLPAPVPDEVFLARLRQSPGSTPSDRAAIPVEGGAGSTFSELGPYDVLGRLGGGGMGTVYKARHRDLDKIVALKVLPANRVDEVSVLRFRTEMKAAGRLDHPNIVSAYDAGCVGQTHFLVMELVDGLDLSHLVGRCGALRIADACELGRQAATGLAHAHQRNLIHRDIKPSNLMLARGGVLKILDLGLARLPASGVDEGLTHPGTLLGTADYVAPEQIDRAHSAGQPADIYGLGTTLYFLLAGEPPFSGERHKSWLDKLRAHQVEPVPPLRGRRADVPAALAALVEQMVAKNPDERPTAGEVASELRAFAAGADLRGLLNRAGVEAVAGDASAAVDTEFPGETRSGWPSARQADRRTRRLAIAAGLVGSVSLAGLLWQMFRGQPEPLPPDPARILQLDVHQVRGDDATPVGRIGEHHPILINDSLRFSVKLAAPAYSYLIAFNPDGREQLCHPESAEPPPQATEFEFPQESSTYFRLDQKGTQAFVLVASSRPLPRYVEWRASAGTPPWNAKPGDTGGVWRFSGGAWKEEVDRADVSPPSKSVAKLKLPDFLKKRSGGGKVEKLSKPVPKALDDLKNFFPGRTEFDAIEVLSFPVSPDPG